MEEVKEIVGKFGRGPNGKEYFVEFREDLAKLKLDMPDDQKTSEILNMENAVDNIIERFAYLQQLISDYDTKLMNVIVRHEDDFLAAYKTHMSKVEKQLQMLKDKARDQEKKLNNDERIVRMEK